MKGKSLEFIGVLVGLFLFCACYGLEQKFDMKELAPGKGLAITMYVYSQDDTASAKCTVSIPVNISNDERIGFTVRTNTRTWGNGFPLTYSFQNENLEVKNGDLKVNGKVVPGVSFPVNVTATRKRNVGLGCAVVVTITNDSSSQTNIFVSNGSVIGTELSISDI